MEQGSFEDSIKKKIEGKEAIAPQSVWDNIEGELNADLIGTYNAQRLVYKWVAVAAVLMAFCSFAFQIGSNYFSTTTAGGSYNALLSDKYFVPITNDINSQNSYLSHRKITPFVPYERAEKPTSSILDSETLLAKNDGYAPILVPDSKQVDFFMPNLEVEGEIYPYHQGPSYSMAKVDDKSESKLWAGLEAGAGNFNSMSNNVNGMVSGIDPVVLAESFSANTSSDFVNPSSSLNSDINTGVAMTVGLGLGMRVGKKWAIETGVSYTTAESNGSGSVNVLDSYRLRSPGVITLESNAGSGARGEDVLVEESRDYNIELASTTRFTSVPLTAGYYLVEGKMSLRLNVGVAANYFITNQINGGNGAFDGSLDATFNQWSFDGLGGVEIGYAVVENFDVFLEPNYRQAITPMNMGTDNTTSRFLIQTGLKYTLK